MNGKGANMEQKNDTHGAAGEGWYGFDLDGTLAKYDKWEGIDHIGEPIVPMVKLIKQLHNDGKIVKILTARVAPRPGPDTKPNPYMEGNWCIQEPDVQTWALYSVWTAKEFIQEWCYRHLGFIPEITHEKDHLMLELYDDRVKQVVPNTGVLVEDDVKRLSAQVDRLWADRLSMINSKLESQFRLQMNRICAFFCGCLFVLVILVLLEFFVLDTDESEKVTAARELHDAACRYLKVSQESLFEKIQKDNLTPASGL
jgi:hypothetical protein